MSDGGGFSATGVVLAAARRCVELEALGDVGSLLELTRVYEELVVAAHVGQARILSRLTVLESSEFSPTAEALPGPDVVTPQEIATVLEMSVESVRTRLAVADTLAVMPTVCAAAEAGQLRWWQVRRAVESAWRLPQATQAALDTRLAQLAAEAGCGAGSPTSCAGWSWTSIRNWPNGPSPMLSRSGR